MNIQSPEEILLETHNVPWWARRIVPFIRYKRATCLHAMKVYGEQQKYCGEAKSAYEIEEMTLMLKSAISIINASEIPDYKHAEKARLIERYDLIVPKEKRKGF